MNSENKSEHFELAIETFLIQIESLWTTLPNVLKTMEKSKMDTMQKYDAFLLSECEYIESENHYLIKPEHNRKFRILKKKADNNEVAYIIIKRNFIVSLISQFDTYIGALIKSVFLVRPELLNSSEKQLTYSQLNTFNNLNDARDYIIEKEIESVLRENHTEQFRWFEKKLSINLLKDLSIWTTFIELTQRRNLFVHSNGKVSSQYLNVCKENNVKLSSDLKIGDELDVDLKYFENAFTCLFEIGLKLNQVLRRKLIVDEILNADKSFLNISFELIQNSQYQLAKEIYDFADKYIKKYSSNDIFLRVALNRAQVYKWLGQNEKCIEIIDSIDWSATGDLFKLSSATLKDEYKKGAEIIRNVGDNNKVLDKSIYKDWPIFKEFIKTIEFKDAYKVVYHQEFEIVEEKSQAKQL